MFIKKSDKAHVGREGTRKHHLVPMFIALVFAAMIYPHQTHAQIIGTIEADIPFQFHAGNTRLPAGKYFIRMVDDSDLTIMEISKPDGSVAALFQVRSAEANSTPRQPGGRVELRKKSRSSDSGSPGTRADTPGATTTG